jgi:hypothetical protein
VNESVGVIGAVRRAGLGANRAFISGDEADAKADVAALFGDAGFGVIDSATSRQVVRCSRSTTRSPGST